MNPFQSVNPATGEVLAIHQPMTAGEVQRIIEQAHQAFIDWRTTPITSRAAIMQQAAVLLRRDVEPAARLMAQEMGKPVVQGRAEVEKCAWVCEYYAQHAGTFLSPEAVPTDATNSYVAFEPLGVILAVMPWNFPFWQVFRAAVPALMAGNAVLLKHAANVFGCAAVIERILHEAGLPKPLFRSVLVGSDQVASLIEHPFICGVTLTGSTPAGQAVAAKAGSLLKKSVLELGGSDPYIVLEDADLELTVEACVTSRLVNSGQSCIAAKRFIVVEPIRKRFEQRCIELMRSRVMGDPLREDVTVGPMARRDLRDGLQAQVQGSVQRGATLALGGEIPDGPGAFYPPTVLTDVRQRMPAYDEELFGPVAAIIGVKDESEAIRVANDSSFGLGAAIFTADRQRGERIARQLEVGCCFINAFVRSDPRLPFGGIKQSGYGRELAIFGIREFVNIKTIYVK